MRYQIKYGPEVINEHDDWFEATALAEYESGIRDGVRLYVYDTVEEERFDREDWENVNPSWNEHLSL